MATRCCSYMWLVLLSYRELHLQYIWWVVLGFRERQLHMVLGYRELQIHMVLGYMELQLQMGVVAWLHSAAATYGGCCLAIGSCSYSTYSGRCLATGSCSSIWCFLATGSCSCIWWVLLGYIVLQLHLMDVAWIQSAAVTRSDQRLQRVLQSHGGR